MLLCRSMERGETAAQEIREATKGEVTVFRWAALIITTSGIVKCDQVGPEQPEECEGVLQTDLKKFLQGGFKDFALIS